MVSTFILFAILSVSLTNAQFERCTAGNLPATCFCGTEQVTCSGLPELPPWIDFPSNTKEFTCLGCAFNDLKQLDYIGIEKLLLVTGQLKNISSGAFSQIENLRSLDLSHNPMEEIRPDMFEGLHNLTELRLVNFQMNHFSTEISKMMPKLTKLDLSSNKGISFSTDAFEHSMLETFRLNDCELIEPPVLVGSNLNSVQHFEFNMNKVATLGDGSFWLYEGLRKLMIEKCDMLIVHRNAFEGLSELEELYLGENKLDELPAGVFSHTKGVKILDLRKNELKTLKYDVVKDLENLESVDLSDNPWVCDCSITWIHDVNVPTTTNLTCSSPEKFAGEGVLNATATLDCPCGYDGCDAKSSYVALAVGIPIIIICLCLIAFFIFKIVQGRRSKSDEKKVRYSAVYRDTTENRGHPDTKPTSEL